MFVIRVLLWSLCLPLLAQSDAQQLEEAIHSIRKKVDEYLLHQNYQAAIEQLESFQKRFPDNTHFDELRLALQKLYQVQQLDPSHSPPPEKGQTGHRFAHASPGDQSAPI